MNFVIYNWIIDNRHEIRDICARHEGHKIHGFFNNSSDGFPAADEQFDDAMFRAGFIKNEFGGYEWIC